MPPWTEASSLPELLQSPPNRDCGIPAFLDRMQIRHAQLQRGFGQVAGRGRGADLIVPGDGRHRRRASPEVGRATAGRSGRSKVRAARFRSDFRRRTDHRTLPGANADAAGAARGSGIGRSHGLAQQFRCLYRRRIAQLVVGQPSHRQSGGHRNPGQGRTKPLEPGRRASDASISSNLQERSPQASGGGGRCGSSTVLR